MLKRILTPVFAKIARSLGIAEIQARLNALENEARISKVSDETYAAIETRFRGSTELIKDRQKQYIPFVSKVVTAETPLLDIGCGRGEWLSLMRDAKIPSSGIDSNKSFVEQSKALGLEVVLGDATIAMRNFPNQSLGAVTMFQVAEHLPLRVLEELLLQIHRTLKVGGVAIIEIPNLETTRVGAGTFWIDPTHVRPLFPDFLVFLAERAGFSSIQTMATTPLDDSQKVSGDDAMSRMVQSLWNRMNGPGDFAIIATK